MTSPKITVYIASHNYGEYLGQSIESVLRQSIDCWELLVIDDNSSDNTADVIRLYQGDPRIRAFRTEGIGLPAVCNLAMEESRGEYIIRLDGDDIFDENILLILSNFLDHNPDYAMVFPDYYLIDEQNEIFAHERRQKVFENNHVMDMPPNGACTMIRTSVMKECGGYRVDLGSQDGFDIWSKISVKHKTGNVNLPLFYYRRHQQNLTNKTHYILNARRAIKKDAILHELHTFGPFTVVIPSRKRYDFCPDVWNMKIGNRSLLQIAIEECIKSQTFDFIIVASDNPEAEMTVRSYDDARLSFFLRNARDTIRSKSIASTIDRIVQTVDPSLSGVTMIRYIQSPFVKVETMEEALFTLVMNDADSAIGVEEITMPLYRRTAHGLELINPKREFKTDFDVIYYEANTAIATRSANFRTGALTGSRIVNFVVAPEECFFIDSDLKMAIAGLMLEKK